MIDKRLKLLRLARGMTMEALSAAIGGIVTKQAISKYELGKDTPSAHVLMKLAKALGVKSVDLWREPSISVDLIAYRKGSGLKATEQHRVESLIQEALEQRVQLQELTNQTMNSDVPVKNLRVDSLADAEKAATSLRKKWKLGLAPIASMTGVLEDHLIHVIEITANPKFDGISAVAKEGHSIRAAVVVSRLGLPGERQRLNLAHELGHLVLDIAPEVDEEKAAFRFAGAFLAPIDIIRREVGESRAAIGWTELLLLKKNLGISVQAILYRLRDLSIITDNYYHNWFKVISRSGFRKAEPNPLSPETPSWMNRTVLRALTEGLISFQDAERISNPSLKLPDPSLSLIKQKAFMALSVPQRRQHMEKEAERLKDYYDGVVARGEVEVADTL